MSGSRCWTVVCLLVALWGFGPYAAAAQIGSGTLRGSVVDQGDAAVPGATLTITAAGTNLSRATVTGKDGAYVVPGLAPGSYAVSIELNGFRPLIREGIRLSTGETVRLDLRLELGTVTERVTV